MKQLQQIILISTYLLRWLYYEINRHLKHAIVYFARPQRRLHPRVVVKFSSYIDELRAGLGTRPATEEDFKVQQVCM